MTITLYHGDCLIEMDKIADESIDAVIADLPYGTTACRWDTVIPLEPLWECYKRIVKPKGAIVLFSSQPFTSRLVMSNLKWFKYEWCWDKIMPTGHLDAKRKPLKYHENILVFADSWPNYYPQKWDGKPNHSRRSSKKKQTGGIYGAYHNMESDVSGKKYPRSIVAMPKVHSSVTIHPTQKPVALLEYFVRTYTNEGETVLDNCFGSCTTGVACLNTGRNFVGIERDTDYFRVGKARIADAQRQLAQPKQLRLDKATR